MSLAQWWWKALQNWHIVCEKHQLCARVFFSFPSKTLNTNFNWHVLLLSRPNSRDAWQIDENKFTANRRNKRRHKFNNVYAGLSFLNGEHFNLIVTKLKADCHLAFSNSCSDWSVLCVGIEFHMTCVPLVDNAPLLCWYTANVMQQSYCHSSSIANGKKNQIQEDIEWW